jgi:hypothetical protein
MSDSFHVNFSFSEPVVIEKRIFEIRVLYEDKSKLFSPLWPYPPPPPPPGTMIWKNLIQLCQKAVM